MQPVPLRVGKSDTVEQKWETVLPLKDFTLRRMQFNTTHFCDGSAGIRSASFGFVIRGTDELDLGDQTLILQEGSFFFLPGGIRYRSRWSGSPDIAYYMLHLTPAREGDWDYLPARIDALSGSETLASLTRAQRALERGETGGFEAAAELLPLLKRAADVLVLREKDELSPILTRAVSFVREHFTEDYSASDLARHCFVSESRLYHLFEAELHLSPLQLRNEMRVEKAASLLRDGACDLAGLTAATGFSSASYLRRLFREQMGMTLSAYARAVR